MSKQEKTPTSVAEWASQFRAHALACRTSVPLPSHDELSAAEEWQCRIVGRALLDWLKTIGPHFLQQRAVLAKLLEIHREPFIVFT